MNILNQRLLHDQTIVLSDQVVLLEKKFKHISDTLNATVDLSKEKANLRKTIDEAEQIWSVILPEFCLRSGESATDFSEKIKLKHHEMQKSLQSAVVDWSRLLGLIKLVDEDKGQVISDACDITSDDEAWDKTLVIAAYCATYDNSSQPAYQMLADLRREGLTLSDALNKMVERKSNHYNALVTLMIHISQQTFGLLHVKVCKEISEVLPDLKVKAGEGERNLVIAKRFKEQGHCFSVFQARPMALVNNNADQVYASFTESALTEFPCGQRNKKPAIMRGMVSDLLVIEPEVENAIKQVFKGVNKLKCDIQGWYKKLRQELNKKTCNHSRLLRLLRLLQCAIIKLIYVGPKFDRWVERKSLKIYESHEVLKACSLFNTKISMATKSQIDACRVR